MWEGNLLPFDWFQPKKIITIMWKDNLPPIDRFQPNKVITIMWEDNLLPFDRFQKKTLQLCDGANYFQMTISRKKNYNYARGQITTFWQIPEKNFTIMRWGKLLPNDNFEKKKLQLCEMTNYYLMTDSRQKK